MLNEFCLTTGYHRKYAIRILNGPPPGKRPGRPVRQRGLSYGHELLSTDQRMGGRRVSLVGTLESAAAGLDAVDPQALQVKPGDQRAYRGRELDPRTEAAGLGTL